MTVPSALIAAVPLDGLPTDATRSGSPSGSESFARTAIVTAVRESVVAASSRATGGSFDASPCTTKRALAARGLRAETLATASPRAVRAPLPGGALRVTDLAGLEGAAADADQAIALPRIVAEAGEIQLQVAGQRAERERAALRNALATLREGVEVSLPAAP